MIGVEQGELDNHPQTRNSGIVAQLPGREGFLEASRPSALGATFRSITGIGGR